MGQYIKEYGIRKLKESSPGYVGWPLGISGSLEGKLEQKWMLGFRFRPSRANKDIQSHVEFIAFPSSAMFSGPVIELSRVTAS